MDFCIPADIWEDPRYAAEEKLILAILSKNAGQAMTIQEIADSIGISRQKTTNFLLHLFFDFGASPPIARTKKIINNEKLLVAYKYEGSKK